MNLLEGTPVAPVMSAARALTLWQPYAWAIPHGGKRIENRPIPPPRHLVGRRLAIAAAARVAPHYEAEQAAAIQARTGVVVPPSSTLVRSAIVSVVTVHDFIDARGSDAMHASMTRSNVWWLGPVGIVLTDVVAIEPVDISGDRTFHRGYWLMTPALRLAVWQHEQIARAGAH